MPIYEFYCPDCHRIFNFLSRSIDTRGRPGCPRCGRPDLERRPSSFAISKGRKEPGSEEEPSGLDDERLEKAMASMASEVEGLDDENPRQAARVMRKLYEAAGLPVTGGMAEALRRMEAGEDPEQVEAELGDALEEDPFSAAPEEGFKALRRKYLPPTVDTELHEM